MLGRKDRVLVTGGTGVTGRQLVKKLCELGCRVRVFVRPSSDRSVVNGHPVEWVEGNVFDERAVRTATKDVDYVFHLAGAFREAKATDDHQRLVHVRGTQLLAESAAQNDELKRFVHVSTVGVLGHIDRPPANEATAYNPGDIYQRTKAEGERWLMDFAAADRLPFVVVRPAAIHGPGDRRLLKLFRMATLPIVPLVGFTKGLYHLIHVDDLVDFMILAAHHPKALGELFICGNPAPTTIREVIETVGAHLGKVPRFVRVPAWPLVFAGAACERICRPLGIEPPLHRRRVAFFTKDRAFDTSKMQRLTGFTCKYSNSSGLLATAEWYRHHGWL